MPASKSAQSDKEWADAISERLSLEQAGFIEYPTGSNLTVNQPKISILVAHASRRSVNTFGNDQTPINWIPLELLTHIFALCALVDPISWVWVRADRKASVKPGWLNFTYVCSLWRKVALNYPALWASHATNEFGTRWMRTMLERSKRAPVSLRVDLKRMVDSKDGRPSNQGGWLGIEDGWLEIVGGWPEIAGGWPEIEGGWPEIEGGWPGMDGSLPDNMDGEAGDEDDEPSGEDNTPSDEDNEPSDEDNEPSDEDNEPSDEDNEPTVKDSGLIAEHLSHISDITFINLPGGLQKDQFDFLQRPAPMLDSMRIDVPRYSCISDDFSPVVSTLPRDFLSSHAPRLRRLHLYEYLPPLTRPVSRTFSDLEHLHVTSWSLRITKNLSGGADGPEARLLIKWPQILGPMKKLKTLSLKYCLPQYVDSASLNNAILEFPDLQSLEIEDYVRDCGAFLQHLRIPATAQVSIHCDTQEEYRTFREAWLPVVSFVHAHLNAGSSPIQALSLEVPDPNSVGGSSPTFNAVVWRSQVAFPAASRPEGFTLALKLTFQWFYYDEDGNPMAPTIHPFMQALDTPLLADVRTAQYELGGKAAWNLMHVAPVLRHTQAIETLCVAGPDGGHTVAHVLQPQPYGSADAQLSHALPLPALKMLTLWKVDLGANSEWRKEDAIHVRLHACLQAREAAQGHFLTLRIRECAMKLQWWTALRQVADVSWDGRDVEIYTKNFALDFSDLETVPLSLIL